jgi:hypothetical protein
MPATAAITMIEDHLPEAYVFASRASAKGQRQFKRLTWIALLLLVVAGAGGLVEGSWGGWVSLGAFVGSLLVSALAIYQRSEQDWYDGRAVAESTKSIVFKYAVGGEPFGVANPQAETRFHQTLAALLSELKKLHSTIELPKSSADLGALRQLRSSDLPIRSAAYQAQRLDHQRNWYRQRASEHRRTANAWRAAMLGAEIFGAAGAALKGLSLVEVDLFSLFATVAAAAAAWIAAGDYSATTRAYDFAALELGQAVARLPSMGSEEKWAQFVADCEQAMSREHTMWLARRRASGV